MYDLIVIGSGPGGYVCAIRAAQLGLKVACVEGRETLGGTCLNVGCIPSKALLQATHLYREAREHFATIGLVGETPTVDWEKMQAYKQEAVDSNTRGVEFLFKKNKVDWISGWASIPGAGKVKIGDEIHETKAIVIATGSVSMIPGGISIDNDAGVVVDSTGALSLPRIPERMIVIGAGVTGLELSSVYARLGTNVHVMVRSDEVLRGMDHDVTKTALRMLRRQGLNFLLNAQVHDISVENGAATLTWASSKGGDEQTIEADVVLVAAGRRANTEGLGVEALGIALDRGVIVTDANWQTNIPGIYAIGDVTRGPMLAHKASDEGIAVAEVIAGRKGVVNYDIIPSVVYVSPEIATVGMSEAEAKAAGHKVKIGKFQMMGNPRARVMLETAGFVKFVVDADTDRILGCHIIAPGAGEIIHEIAVGMSFGASAEDIALTCHAHPTISEAVREAAHACGSGAIHA